MFIQYAISKYKQEQEEMAYRIYVTDSIYYRNQNKALSERYIDLIRHKVDDRDGDEIVAEIIQKAGLNLKG